MNRRDLCSSKRPTPDFEALSLGNVRLGTAYYIALHFIALQLCTPTSCLKYFTTTGINHSMGGENCSDCIIPKHFKQCSNWATPRISSPLSYHYFPSSTQLLLVRTGRRDFEPEIFREINFPRQFFFQMFSTTPSRCRGTCITVWT